jgi:hypothetical protein
VLGCGSSPPAFFSENTTFNLTYQDYYKLIIIPIKLIKCDSGRLRKISGPEKPCWQVRDMKDGLAAKVAVSRRNGRYGSGVQGVKGSSVQGFGFLGIIVNYLAIGKRAMILPSIRIFYNILYILSKIYYTRLAQIMHHTLGHQNCPKPTTVGFVTHFITSNPQLSSAEIFHLTAFVSATRRLSWIKGLAPAVKSTHRSLAHDMLR